MAIYAMRWNLEAALLVTTALSLPLTFSNPAWAQGASGLEEIIVTARKREENLQSIPLSVTAFTSEAIQAQGIHSVYQLQDFTPNFSFDKGFGRRFDRPIMRGQSSVQTSDVIAAFFIDGVFVSGSITSTSTDALERIEVLRGPQSALYGRATFGGAINYITKQPSNTFEGEINSRVGSHDDYKGAVWIRGPIVEDKLQFFLSGNWEYYGGQWRNDDPGTPASSSGPVNNFVNVPTRPDNSRVGNEETRDITGKLRFIPTENLQFNVKYDHTRSEDGHFATVWFSGNDLNCFRPGIDPGTPNTARGYYCGEFKIGSRKPHFNLPDFIDGVSMYQVTGTGALALVNGQPVLLTAAPADPGVHRKTDRLIGDASLEVANWNAFVQASYYTDDSGYVADGDRTLKHGPVSTVTTVFENGAAQTELFEHYKDYSIETRLESPQQQRLRGMVGAFYYNSKFKTRQRSFTGTVVALTRFAADGSDFARTFVKNKSVFGQLQFDITDQFNLTAEGRYAKESRRVPDTATTRPVNVSFTSFTPRISADYNIDTDLMFYASFAVGNLPGGVNPNYYNRTTVSDASFATAATQNRVKFDEEKSNVYEIGTKLKALDNRAIVNFDVYYIDWSKQKLNNTDTTVIQTNGTANPGVAYQVNSGTSRVQGVEFSGDFIATEQLTLTLGYGLADHKFLKANDDTELFITTGRNDPLLVNGGNAKGKRSILAPRHTANAAVTWRDDFTADVEWVFRNDFSYQSRKYGEIANYSWVGGRYLWNAHFGLESDRWTLTFYGNNLLDDLTPSAIFRFADSSVTRFAANPGASKRGFDIPLPRGREFGVTAQYNF